MRSRSRSLWTALVVVLIMIWTAACTAGTDDPPADSHASASVDPSASAAIAAQAAEHAAPSPGPLTETLLSADLLVFGPRRVSDRQVRRIKALKGVTHVNQFSLGQISVENKVLTVAAVDPGTFRRYTPVGTAQLQEAWDRVAGGEIAVDPVLGKELQDATGSLTLGNDVGAPRLHIGALAAQMPRVNAVVNRRWGRTLGITGGNALLVSTGFAAPQKVRGPIQRLVGKGTSVQLLGPDLDVQAVQTAFLSGGSLAAAVGTFSYRFGDGGTITPDSAWVRDNIRTEQVPILGAVTCHKVLIPQLRAALSEVVTRGLIGEIHPDEYAGCYYPRFIADSTQLSLHSFGIALDLNVPGNQRGTAGEMNRDVVAIFKKWGFGWGGDWAWTDPMHFELNRLVEVR